MVAIAEKKNPLRDFSDDIRHPPPINRIDDIIHEFCPYNNKQIKV